MEHIAECMADFKSTTLQEFCLEHHKLLKIIDCQRFEFGFYPLFENTFRF